VRMLMYGKEATKYKNRTATAIPRKRSRVDNLLFA